MQHHVISHTTLVVVQLAGAVNRDAHQKIACCQKRATLVVQQNAVGLERIRNFLPRPIVLLKGRDPLEKLDAWNPRLAALQVEVNENLRLYDDLLPMYDLKTFGAFAQSFVPVSSPENPLHYDSLSAPGALAMPRCRQISTRLARSVAFRAAARLSAARLRSSRGSTW